MPKTLTPQSHRATTEKAVALRKDFNLDATVDDLCPRIEATLRIVGTAVDECTQRGAELLEIREKLKLAAGGAWNAPNKPTELTFKSVLERVAAYFRPASAKAQDSFIRNLYRWIEMAENSRQYLLDNAIDIEAIAVSDGISLSQLLTMPAAELSEVAGQAQQLLFSWMKDNPTMKDRLAVTAMGGDEGHNLTRARNGATKGGSGGDRKDFPAFTLRKFSDVNAHWAHEMSATQRTEILSIIPAAINGGTVGITRDGNTKAVKFEAWPEDFAEAAFDALKERFKGRKR